MASDEGWIEFFLLQGFDVSRTPVLVDLSVVVPTDIVSGQGVIFTQLCPVSEVTLSACLPPEGHQVSLQKKSQEQRPSPGSVGN